jgi:hypothetical protein
MNISPFQKQLLFGGRKEKDGEGKKNPWFACMMRPWMHPNCKVPVSFGLSTFTKNYTDSFSLNVNVTKDQYGGSASFRWYPSCFIPQGVSQYWLGYETTEPTSGEITAVTETAYNYGFHSQLAPNDNVIFERKYRVVGATARFKYIGPSVVNSGFVVVSNTILATDAVGGQMPIGSDQLLTLYDSKVFPLGHDFVLRYTANETNFPPWQFWPHGTQDTESWPHAQLHVKVVSAYSGGTGAFQTLGCYHVTIDLVIEFPQVPGTVGHSSSYDPLLRYTMGTLDWNQYFEAMELAHKAGWFEISPYPTGVMHRGLDQIESILSKRVIKSSHPKTASHKAPEEDEFVQVQGPEGVTKIEKSLWKSIFGGNITHDEL